MVDPHFLLRNFLPVKEKSGGLCQSSIFVNIFRTAPMRPVPRRGCSWIVAVARLFANSGVTLRQHGCKDRCCLGQRFGFALCSAPSTLEIYSTTSWCVCVLFTPHLYYNSFVVTLNLIKLKKKPTQTILPSQTPIISVK